MPQSSILKSFSVFVFSASLFGASLVPTPGSVTVHEWGTFTSVAGYDGKSMEWAPLSVTSDLPCFVHKLGSGGAKYVPGLVRMETPVVYFYTQSPAKVSVHVDFPQGQMTEWYPKARVWPDAPRLNTPGSIEWADLNLMPGANPDLPSGKGASRYYAARATDAVPVQAGDESEKLLFYRGIANFKVPVEPVVSGNGYRIRNHSGATIPVAILFENREGKAGYRVLRNVKDSVAVSTPELTGSVAALRAELTADLVQAGLYPKEAAAMLATWQDSWFEAGTRVIYIDPRSAVDAVLPLTMTPAPAAMERVFVGRVEVLSPWMETTIRNAMEEADGATIAKFGRFLSPFRYAMMKRGVLRENTAGNALAGRIDSANYQGSAPCIR